jgi:hypothetical protein
MHKYIIIALLMASVIVHAKESHKPTVVVVKDGKVKGYDGNIFIRQYGSSGAISCTVQGDTVVITYKNGKVSVYKLADGIRIRSY